MIWYSFDWVEKEMFLPFFDFFPAEFERSADGKSSIFFSHIDEQIIFPHTL